MRIINDGPSVSVFDRMSALADPTRARLLLVLEGHELGVAELCSIFQLPQSTMSRHLKALVEEGLVVSWTEGRSTRHRMTSDRLDASTLKLWELVKEEAAGLPAAEQDARRVRSVLAERRSRSQEFFSSAAGEWDRLRGELFGRQADRIGLLGLLDERWTVGDLGCGTGQVSEVLAPFVGRVIAVDESPEMLAAARARLRERNVEVRRGALEDLPVADGELDAAVITLVLHYVAEPARAVAEAARALRPGGRLLLMDMTPHDREEYRQRMGHLWQGFDAEEARGWAEAAGLTSFRYVPLPPDPEAKGPGLFAATARKI
jgi:SAM-dependent methyltransferase